MTLTLPEEAAALRDLKRKVAAANAAAAEAAAVHKVAERKLIDRMEAELRPPGSEEPVSIRYDGTLFVPTTTEYAQVQDSAEFLAWAEENAPELIGDPQPRKELLNTLVRECLADGTPLPPGLGFYPKPYISQRSA